MLPMQSMFDILSLFVNSIEYFFKNFIYVAKAVENVCKRSCSFKIKHKSNSLHNLYLYDTLHVNTSLSGLTRTFRQKS